MKSTVIVLLAEDNEADIFLTNEMLQQTGIDCAVYPVKDGVKAIDFLLKQNEYHHAPIPDLVILDINLPKRNGRQVLKWIKNSAVNSIPVIIYTSSTLATDIEECKATGADLYLNKPVLINGLETVSKIVQNFILNYLK